MIACGQVVSDTEDGGTGKRLHLELTCGFHMNVPPLVSDNLGNSVKFIFRSENYKLNHRGVSAISLTAAMSSGVKERLMQESEI